MESCRYLWRSPRSNIVHAEYMAKLLVVLFLQSRASQIETSPSGEEETLYSPSGTWVWILWVWMFAILVHKHNQFLLFSFFLCHAVFVDIDLFTVNLATALQEYTWLFIFFLYKSKIFWLYKLNKFLVLTPNVWRHLLYYWFSFQHLNSTVHKPIVSNLCWS